jgi:hypothetical protein
LTKTDGTGLGLARAEREQHEVAGLEHRADALRDAVGRHLVDVVVVFGEYEYIRVRAAA